MITPAEGKVLLRGEADSSHNAGSSRVVGMEVRFQAHIQDFLATKSGSIAAWVRWSTSTRDIGSWRCFYGPGVQPPSDPTIPPVVIPGGLREPVVLPVLEPLDPVGFQSALSPPAGAIESVVVAPIVEQGTQIVAVGFRSKDLARREVAAVEQLASKLFQELKEFRRVQETESLLRVPTAPAHLEGARQGLLDLAHEVARCLEADGAKIYLVRRSSQGPVLWRAANTGLEIVPRPVPFSPDRGLADYVIWRKTWLLIPHSGPVSGDPRPNEGVRQEGMNGRGEQVVVHARVGREIDPKAPRERTDEESSILVYPLETDGQITGAVTVWRLCPEDEQPEPLPFDSELDVSSLSSFAKHLAAACQRVMQLQKAEDQLWEIAALARRLEGFERLDEGYGAVAAGAGQLADAACAMLLHYEPKNDEDGYLYQSAIWQAESLEYLSIGDPFFVRCPFDSSTWEDTVRISLGERLRPFVFRKLLIEQPTANTSGIPSLALALFDPPYPEKSPPYFSDGLLDHFSTAFFQAAAQSLRSQVRGLANRLLDLLAGPYSSVRGSISGPEWLLYQSARLLCMATGADQILIYIGSPHHLDVQASFPSAPQLRGLQIPPKSRVARLAAQKKPYRLLRVDKLSGDIDSEHLALIIQRLGWNSAQSCLVYPLTHEHRILGLVTLLTCEAGGILGRDHGDVTQQVVRYIAWEMHKAARQRALEELLKLINLNVGNIHGNQLGEVLVMLLREWTAKILFRPEARVLILARSERSGTLVRAGASKEVLDSLENSLGPLTYRFRSSGQGFWDNNESSELHVFAPHGIGGVLTLFGDRGIYGVVCLGDDEAFGEQDLEILREASRLLSVVLNAERERNDQKVVMGRFRHAVLGPIQGITSTAGILAEIASEIVRSAGVDPVEVTKASSMIKKEAEVLRLWRENQRFYLSDDIALKRRPHALRPLVERCYARYREIVKERGVHYLLSWRPAGELRLHLDEAALDVALSNLLDNAAKYVFSNQKIEIGVAVGDGMVNLWVEDIGHGIDSKAVERIFQPQERANPEDPFRIISGEGLGLAMAYRIVEAHDGRLTVKSERYASGKHKDTTPYRVRFTIQLPFSPAR
jgi:hypothetical protein